MEHIVKIKDIRQITHNVKRFRFEKPKGFKFVSGQATDVSVNKHGWENRMGPFTFTCLPNENYLEFIIKIYNDRHALTEQIGKLKVGDSFIIRDPFGTIHYKRKGVFIAGGAGITPFIAILRNLHKKNKLKGNTLIFSNKTERDIILKDELKGMVGNNCIFLLTEQKRRGYDYGRIGADYLRRKIKDFKQNFYICGPSQMIVDLKRMLDNLGVKPESVVFEM